MEEVAPLAAELVIGRSEEAEEKREEEEEQMRGEEEEEMREKGEEVMILWGCTMERLVVDRFSGMEMAGPEKI